MFLTKFMFWGFWDWNLPGILKPILSFLHWKISLLKKFCLPYQFLSGTGALADNSRIVGHPFWLPLLGGTCDSCSLFYQWFEFLVASVLQAGFGSGLCLPNTIYMDIFLEKNIQNKMFFFNFNHILPLKCSRKIGDFELNSCKRLH